MIARFKRHTAARVAASRRRFTSMQSKVYNFLSLAPRGAVSCTVYACAVLLLKNTRLKLAVMNRTSGGDRQTLLLIKKERGLRLQVIGQLLKHVELIVWRNVRQRELTQIHVPAQFTETNKTDHSGKYYICRLNRCSH